MSLINWTGRSTKASHVETNSSRHGPFLGVFFSARGMGPFGSVFSGRVIDMTTVECDRGRRKEVAQ